MKRPSVLVADRRPLAAAPVPSLPICKSGAGLSGWKKWRQQPHQWSY